MRTTRHIAAAAFIASMLLPQFASAALTTNLVGYWKMDESSGNAADSSGNSNTLTNTNATFSAGKINNAAVFTAASSPKLSIASGSQTGLAFTSDFTVNTWMNFTTGVNDYYNIIINGDPTTCSPTGANSRFDLAIDPNAASKHFYVLGTSDGSTYTQNSTSQLTGFIPTGTWYMFTFTWSASTHTLTVYWNNSLETTLTSDPATSLNSSAKTFQVNGVCGGASYESAKIDELGVWSRVLSGTEITQLYNSGAGLQYPFVIANNNQAMMAQTF